ARSAHAARSVSHVRISGIACRHPRQRRRAQAIQRDSRIGRTRLTGICSVERGKVMNVDPKLIRHATLLTVMLSFALAAVPAFAPAIKPAVVRAAVSAAYERYRDLQEGKNADYIPALAKVDSSIYGIALVTVDSKSYTAGDVTSEVSIQSISKVFTLAKVIEE